MLKNLKHPFHLQSTVNLAHFTFVNHVWFRQFIHKTGLRHQTVYFFYVDLMIHEVAFNCLELFQVILIDKMLTLTSINVDLIQQFDTNITNRKIIRK